MSILTLTAKFQEPKYRYENELVFAQPDNFQEIVDIICNAAKAETSNRSLPVLFVVGPCNMGKTRTAFEAADASINELEKLHYGKWVYVRLDMHIFAGVSNKVAEDELAHALIRQFLGQYVNDKVYYVNLSEVLKKLNQDLGAAGVIVHIDNYNLNIKLAECLITCLANENVRMRTGNETKCIPMVSGLPLGQLQDSSWVSRKVMLQSPNGLVDSLYTQWYLREKLELLDLLLDTCGNNPALVLNLVNIIESSTGMLESIKQGKFDREKAVRIWNQLIERTKPFYERRVWLDVYGSSIDDFTTSSFMDVQVDRQLDNKVEAIVGRLLNLSISGALVNEDDLIVPELDPTLTFRNRAILFDLKGSPSSGFVVHIPLVIAFIVNDEFKVFPTKFWPELEAKLEPILG